MERAELAGRLGAKGGTPDSGALVVEERDPVRFMAGFAAAVAGRGPVFLSDPAWGAAERAQFAALLDQEGKTQVPETGPGTGWLFLPTGGSSGRMRLARHDQDTLAAAADGCARHFGLARMNAVGVLPLHHVSGLMAWMRCALSGGSYRPWSWRDLEDGRRPDIGPGEWFLSLVPTQLQRLLDRGGAEDWLRRFRAVFIGGGPVWSELLARAAAAGLPLSPGYGMTETAAMVATLLPEEFLAGREGCGRCLPHARVTVDAEGVISIESESLFRGYHPHLRAKGPWTTDDHGRWDESGSLHVLGRRDAVIITGGKKVDPGEVEAALRATEEFEDVAVVSVPDPVWGETVVACHAIGAKEPDLRAVKRLLAGRLAPHKRPKHYVKVETWPRSDQGKLNRPALAALARRALEREGG